MPATTTNAQILAFHGIHVTDPTPHTESLHVEWPNHPPAVANPGAWTVNVFPMRERNGQWKVLARRGSVALHCERLSAADVVALDLDARNRR